MITISTLESIIWLILIFSFISVFLLLLTRRPVCQKAKFMNELITQDEKLSDNIISLQNKIFDLDEDLKKIIKNSAILREEIRMLTERVNNLQNQIRMKEGENASSNS